MFLFWIVIVAGIALWVAGLGRQSTQPADRGESPRSESPMEILKQSCAESLPAVSRRRAWSVQSLNDTGQFASAPSQVESLVEMG